MIAWLLGEADEAVAFGAVAAPRVNTIDVQQQVRPQVQILLLSYELEIEREGEVADEVGPLNLIIIIVCLFVCLFVCYVRSFVM